MSVVPSAGQIRSDDGRINDCNGYLFQNHMGLQLAGQRRVKDGQGDANGCAKLLSRRSWAWERLGRCGRVSGSDLSCLGVGKTDCGVRAVSLVQETLSFGDAIYIQSAL